jgi:hypothetical protein
MEPWPRGRKPHRHRSPQSCRRLVVGKKFGEGTSKDSSIVVSAGKNADFVFLNLIDQTMFLVDAAGPAAGELTP